MKVDNYIFPKSSFLSLEKDYALIINKIINNPRLCQLLYYTTNDALDSSKPPLTGANIEQLLQNNILISPKIYFDNEVLVYMIITFNDFKPSENPAFRNNIITFDIICHLDCWRLKNFALRPHKIAGELDFMFNNQHLTGIGNVEFLSCNQTLLSDEYAMLQVKFLTYHGEEDKKHHIKPEDDIKYQEYFEKQYN